jgi:hypothetical protein
MIWKRTGSQGVRSRADPAAYPFLHPGVPITSPGLRFAYSITGELIGPVIVIDLAARVVPYFSISDTGEGLYRLPAPAVVVLADDVLAITGHPRCAVVALTAVFARFIAVPPVGKRVAA